MSNVTLDFVCRSLVSLPILIVSLSSIAAQSNDRPNILLIVADDLGYSDIGVFGSEIDTPNLDSLAQEGISLRRFHAAPNCGPSRASLLTGVDFHRAGVGGNAEVAAENQRGLAAYQGFLRNDVVTIPELLRGAGYHTYRYRQVNCPKLIESANEYLQAS